MPKGASCRSCDGQGSRTTEDRENVFRTVTKTCGPCRGSGVDPGPSNGRRRTFGPKKGQEDDESLDRAADSFLRRHGYGKGGL